MGGGALLGALLLATAVEALRRPQDMILQAKCLLQCERSASPALNNYKDYVYKCAKECLLRGWEDKPGECPAKGPRDHSMACISECHTDAQCASFDKCCRHACGQTCQPPSSLQYVSGLPEMVTEIRHVERKRLGVVVVTWGSGPRALSLRRASIRLPAPEVYYVVEERRLAGATLRPEAMGPWSPAHRAPKPHPRAKLKLRPGHWYQLRVAAVGINGTRGFSEPTPHFKLSTKPSPAGPPIDVMMSNLVKRNGTVSGLLSWDPPEFSDLPLLGYNVQWTRIRGSPQYTVSKRLTRDKTSVKLRHLEPDSTYEMVVEAMSQYDKETLVSSPAKLTINTTTYTKR